MRKGSGKKLRAKLKDIKVIYAYEISRWIDTRYASEDVKAHIDVPIIIDKNNYIIDGHHRYYYLKNSGAEYVDVIRLNMTFEESKPWRAADVNIKEFAKKTGNKVLYDKFKELSLCLAE